MADPPAVEYTGLDAFKFGTQSASEYLEALYARAEVEKIQMRDKMNKRHRRKPRPVSVEVDATTLDDANLDATLEEESPRRVSSRTRGGRAQMHGLPQRDDIKAEVSSPADHHLPETSVEAPLPVEVANVERKAIQPMPPGESSIDF